MLSLVAITASAILLPAFDDTCATAANGGFASGGSVFFLPRELSSGETVDFFRIAVNAGLRVEVGTLFSHAEANIDLRLWNADCSVLLGESTSLTNEEVTEWLNDTGISAEVVAEVFVAVAPTSNVQYRLRIGGSQELCNFDDEFEPNDDCAAAALLPTNRSLFFPLTLLPSDDDWLAYEVPPTTAVQLFVNSGIQSGDTNAELWSADCSTLLMAVSTPGSDLLSHVNSASTPVLVKLRVFRSDTMPACSTYAVFATTRVGIRECSAVPNSTGFEALLFGAGSGNVTENALFVEASPVPMDQFGLYVYGPHAGSTPLGSGQLCIDGNGLVRGPISQALYMTLSMRVDLAAPAPGQPPVSAGTTLRFQAWFRDPGDPAGFGLSDALRVTFVQ